MNFARSLALCALAALPLASQAAIVTYDFSANVSSMFTFQSTANGDVYDHNFSSTDVPGVTISMGDRVTGRISYDTSAAPAPWVQPGSGGMGYPELINTLTFQFQPSGLQYSGASQYSNLFVSINPSGYRFGALNFSTEDAALHNQGGLNFIDPSSAAPRSLDIPSHINLSDYPIAQVSYYWQSQTGGPDLYVDANISSLTEVSAVPEPSQWLMLAAGALLLAGASRRARRG